MLFLAIDPESGHATRWFPEWTIQDMQELAKEVDKLPKERQDELIEAFNETLGIAW